MELSITQHSVTIMMELLIILLSVSIIPQIMEILLTCGGIHMLEIRMTSLINHSWLLIQLMAKYMLLTPILMMFHPFMP